MLWPTLTVRGATESATPARTLSMSVRVATGCEPISALYAKRNVRDDMPAGRRSVKSPLAAVVTLGIAAVCAPA